VNAGSYHVCGITLAEQAFCWGFNGDGQLGDGTLVNTNSPIAVTGGLTFRQVVGGRYHTCGVTLSNIGYCWGANVVGQLGIGELTTSAPQPTANALALTFINTGAGLQHTCALSHTGVAFCWGWNLEYELGWISTHVTADTANFVFQSAGDTLLSAIGVGGLHTCGLVDQPFALRGQAICWGSNLSGQLGNGTTSFSSFPNHDLVATALTFDSITAGYAHTCGLTSAGQAYCWGDNTDGQLGDGSNANQLTPVPVAGGLTFSSISAGFYHTCAITTTGAGYCWGKNDPNSLEDGGGQLGTGNQTSTNTPAAVVGGHLFRSISAGELMSCGVTTGNIVYCWGDNEFGQLGDGTNIGSNSPVKVAGQP
jgi:alpha-tubulin suppressor-like RCC1 family protein